MATADQIKALIKSHAEGDDARFFAVTMQMAAQAARQGKSRFAEELRQLVDRAKSDQAGVRRRKPVPMVQPRGELSGLLSAGYPSTRLPDMVLDEPVRKKLERVVPLHRSRCGSRRPTRAPGGTSESRRASRRSTSPKASGSAGGAGGRC
jgi:hypothetical protein